MSGHKLTNEELQESARALAAPSPAHAPDGTLEEQIATWHRNIGRFNNSTAEERAELRRLQDDVHALDGDLWRGRECEHDWKIWPETDGTEQRCMKCGAHRTTPMEDRFWLKPAHAPASFDDVAREERRKLTDRIKVMIEQGQAVNLSPHGIAASIVTILAWDVALSRAAK